MTFPQIYLLNFWWKNCEWFGSETGFAGNVLFVSTGLKQHHYPFLPRSPRISKGPVWIGKAFLVVSKVYLFLYAAFVSTRFRTVFLRKPFFMNGVDGIVRAIFQRIISVRPQPSLFLNSWFHMHMVHLQVLYVKKLSQKFSVSSNICALLALTYRNIVLACLIEDMSA